MKSQFRTRGPARAIQHNATTQQENNGWVYSVEIWQTSVAKAHCSRTTYKGEPVLIQNSVLYNIIVRIVDFLTSTYEA